MQAGKGGVWVVNKWPKPYFIEDDREAVALYVVADCSTTLVKCYGQRLGVPLPAGGRQSYRQILVTAGPVRRRRLWADGRSAWR